MPSPFGYSPLSPQNTEAYSYSRFQFTAWTPPPDASRYCISLNAIGAGMRQIQPVIHGNARRAGLHLSDHRGAGESLVAKQCQHRGDRMRRTGDQQSAARLRIAQERLLPRREIVRQTYVMAVTCPVAPGAAGVVTLLRERQRRREDWQRFERDARAEPRAAADLGEMAEQAEAGAIGHRVHPRRLRQPMADGVELRGAGQHLPVPLLRQRAFLERGAENPDAQCLAEHDGVTGACSTVANDALRVNHAERHQTVNRLDRIDRVAAGDGNARGP